MTDATRRTRVVLSLACADRPGLVAAVSTFVAGRGGNIVESQQYGDTLTGDFFMRVAFDDEGGVGLASLREGFAAVAGEHGMSWQLHDASRPLRTLVMVSRFGHCLNDLLFRRASGSLNVEIPAIVSNHRDLEGLAGQYDIPFHHVPVTSQSKPEAEARLLELVDEHDVELVVLARYMQILSDSLARRMAGQVINIHHSFLPSFKGAKPYHQAHARGVKLIGATAHFVTPDLDEGPIIEQDVARVDHRLAPDDLVTVGRDVEARVLARAVGWHAEGRVLLHGDRTVVFS
ncbi:formyltetrahydrofolate deformylase [Marihabitans asiaticum]|uniref:Formyltetrahydrofolate deformylase n=1 Tax=Marihabitans asiaticum TaxID=415218 RepID=A0A560WIF3_9MICO|nr:formyltetrahydrofolate deformylase [Marihabitans asiaticum]TWD17338.1 formyltetrahydrofolate deformylase [Marihabitans asiaticum]